MAGLPTGAVTFLFTDIEGSTTRWEHQTEAMQAALARHDSLLRQTIVSHGGHVVKTMGDAFHAAFSRPQDALAAAVDAQRRLAAESWDEVDGLRVRMALHTGAAEERDGDYYGPPLNRAARLMSAGHGGQILLSQATYDLVRDSLPDGASLLDLGEHRLKDLIRPERIFQVVAPDLSSEFPPLQTLERRPHNLPVHPTALLGRDDEIARVRERLLREDVRLLTLTGPGGTGKTRLSLQVAADLIDQFADGVFFVALAPISDPDLVASTIAQTLDVRVDARRPVIESLKESLASKRLLLVLDNFEQILPAATTVSELLGAAPGLTVLVTSRAALQLRGEHEYPVPPLALPDRREASTPASLSQYGAVSLFIERATAIKPDFAVTNENAPAIAEICHRLDGLPLAIELAAARIRLLTPQTIVSRLERRLPLLTGGARDLPARQQTLRNAIAWSYDLLTPEEQTLYRRLSVFVGGCTLEAAEAVCDPDGSLGLDVLDGVTSLAAQSIVRQVDGPDGEPRFTMLETIREFGLEQLQASGEELALRRSHAVWLLDLVERIDSEHAPNQAEWFDRLSVELGNARAALAWAREHGEPPCLMLRLANGMAWFWYLRGYLGEVGWIETALEMCGMAAADAEATRIRARGLRYLAIMGRSWMPPEHRVALLDESLKLCRGLGDRAGAATAASMLALHLRDLRDYSRAKSMAEEALALCREANEVELPRVMYHLASILYYERFVSVDSGVSQMPSAAAPGAPGIADDYALTLLDESLAIARRRGDVHAVAVMLTGGGGVGEWSLALGDLKRARAAYSDGLAFRWRNRELRGVCDFLDYLARVDLAEGRPERAARLSAAASRFSEATEAQRLPDVWPSREEHQAMVRAHLSEQALSAAWAEGQAMTLEQAVTLALESPPPA